jgi:hypothetical protein
MASSRSRIVGKTPTMAFALNYVREFPGADYHLVKKAAQAAGVGIPAPVIYGNAVRVIKRETAREASAGDVPVPAVKRRRRRGAARGIGNLTGLVEQMQAVVAIGSVRPRTSSRSWSGIWAGGVRPRSRVGDRRVRIDVGLDGGIARIGGGQVPAAPKDTEAILVLMRLLVEGGNRGDELVLLRPSTVARLLSEPLSVQERAGDRLQVARRKGGVPEVPDGRALEDLGELLICAVRCLRLGAEARLGFLLDHLRDVLREEPPVLLVPPVSDRVSSWHPEHGGDPFVGVLAR